MELIRDLESTVEANLPLLAEVSQAWQPSDFLPDLTAEDWTERLGRFRDSAGGLTDELLVVLVGNMVTEEALPSYSMSLNRVTKTTSGDSDAPWARWLRGWTAEENRHGDLLNAYLRLTGRVDMRSVELTIQHLLVNGFDPRHKGDDLAGLIYTSFQERATRITHGNVAKLAIAQGDDNLALICRKIAGDESRHETFYTRVVRKAFEMDPEAGILAFRKMLRGLVAMPGRKMFDGRDPDLFDHFANVSQRIGTYTVRAYSQIIAHLLEEWDIPNLPVSGAAARAQDYLCKQPQRYEFFADEITASLTKEPNYPFSWVHGAMA